MQPAAHAALLAALVPLTGCGSDAIGASEQRAAVTALLATQAAALGVELGAPALLDLEEDATTCPGMSIIQGYITLDYDDCVPGRGWVRAPLVGVLRLDLTDETVASTVEGLAVGPAGVDADLSGARGASPTLALDLMLEGAQLTRAQVDALPTFDGTALVLDGDALVSAGGEPVELSWAGARVPPGSGCFVPTAGRATVVQGLTDVTLAFQGDGTAAVTTSRGDAGTLDLCGLDADLWTP